MFGTVYSAATFGIDGVLVTVEADIGNGLPSFEMVGFLGAEVREARERVRTALKNSGIELPPCRLTINLSPADLRKQGNYFDLGIAIAILIAAGVLPQSYADGKLFVGELGLDGTLRPVNGALSLAGCAKESGVKTIVLPAENAAEAAYIEEENICGCHSLKEVIAILQKQKEAVYTLPDLENRQTVRSESNDFSEINGQLLARRAVEVATAGMHNLLLIGPPGSGKTMIARRIPTILPSMSMDEKIEISKIYSISGLLQEGLISQRPFRSPHHTISAKALIGGGFHPKPGELTLANGGVLFLDELPEFSRASLEALRQPLEDRKVMISRVHGTYTYPTNVMLTAAMNPCPCGFFPDRRRCRCAEGEIRHYLSRISRPLLDRIDLCIEVAKVTCEEMILPEKNESSEVIRHRVEQARLIQKERYQGTGIHFNSELSGKDLSRYCGLGKAEQEVMKKAFESLELSGRAYDRILKMARTIADLEGEEKVQEDHLFEAIRYRSVDQKYWGKIG